MKQFLVIKLGKRSAVNYGVHQADTPREALVLANPPASRKPYSSTIAVIDTKDIHRFIPKVSHEWEEIES